MEVCRNFLDTGFSVNVRSTTRHMSTAGPPGLPPSAAGPPAFAGGEPPVSPSVGTATGSIDPLLIQQTKHEIRSLVQEITHLSRAAIPLEQFYEEYLRRVVSALAAHGGAIWTRGEGGTLEVRYQINLPAECLAQGGEASARHERLLQNVMASGQSTLVPPRSGAPGDEEAGNGTEYLLVLATLRGDQQPEGVIEIFQRAGGGPTTQRGYLRFLVQMSELATEYLRNRRLRLLDDRLALWDGLDAFIQQVHRHLDSRAAAYTIANEGRRLVGCERVSVAIARGRKQHVVAVSGLDSIDRRAEQVKLLSRLAAVVCAARRPLWYTGPNRDLPPQIEKHLDAYLDRSHAAMVAVLPLFPEADETLSEREGTPPPPLGALILEQLSGAHLPEGMAERADAVAVHSASALSLAQEHESLFLLPLWRTLGKARWVVQARTWPKTLLLLLVILAICCGLILVPADFDMASRGKLQPAVRSDVFAHIDGVVVDVPVEHEQLVEPGQVLLRMTNNSLDVDMANLVGRQRTTQERIRTMQRAQLDARSLRIEEQNRLASDLMELRQVEESIARELELLRHKEQQLTVRSEMRGQVVTWNVGTKLLRRPVQRGQLLMTVLDLDGAWELELYMPERRMGHISRAASASPDGLIVTYLLASHPDRPLTGRVVEIQRSADVHGEDGNSVLMRVAIDKRDLPDLRSETTVTARVHCGRRPIGYVLFHELIETVQRKVLFWL